MGFRESDAEHVRFRGVGSHMCTGLIMVSGGGAPFYEGKVNRNLCGKIWIILDGDRRKSTKSLLPVAGQESAAPVCFPVDSIRQIPFGGNMILTGISVFCS